ncbi:hypothetical protein ACFQ9Z_18170 [Streptomyces sp. NPDC056580]|uniref:hypothetical protein n=1 Tax=Streptomyces sp. NPDC056580 TaxID=3345872 RepID=UPI00369171CA
MNCARSPPGKKITVERLYFVPGLPPGTATGEQIAGWIRGHWKIENQLQDVRDTSGVPRPARGAGRLRHGACGERVGRSCVVRQRPRAHEFISARAVFRPT